MVAGRFHKEKSNFTAVRRPDVIQLGSYLASEVHPSSRGRRCNYFLVGLCKFDLTVRYDLRNGAFVWRCLINSTELKGKPGKYLIILNYYSVCLIKFNRFGALTEADSHSRERRPYRILIYQGSIFSFVRDSRRHIQGDVGCLLCSLYFINFECSLYEIKLETMYEYATKLRLHQSDDLSFI